MSRRAFTLLELLLVIAIIAVLLAMLLPTLGSIGTTIKDFTCKNNFKKMHQVVMSYASKFNGRLPPMGTENFSESNEGFPGGTPKNRHLMAEALKDCGAEPKYFCCPFHPDYDDVKNGVTAFNRWDVLGDDGKPAYRTTGSGNWSKYYNTPGYTWLTHAEDFGRHPSGGTVMPNHWATWSRFKNGRPLPTRNDERGNPPVVFDTIKSVSNSSYYGCWHDPDRTSISGTDDDPNCKELAGGGYTLFLAGDVVWFDAAYLYDKGYSYEQQDDNWCYFGMEPPEE
jgi:prepilin-type N-terminal cleavage/methylation domain-containing protein